MSGEPLRVAMVSRRVHPAHGPGGLERSVHDTVVHLAAKGVQVDLYTETPGRMDRTTAAARSMPKGVTIHWVPGRWLPVGTAPGTVVFDRITNYPLWCERVARWLGASQDPAPHLIHAHGLAGSGFSGAGGPPMVLSVHGMEEFQVPAGLKRLAYAPFRARIRRAAAASAAVIATDQALQPLLERFLRIPVAGQALIPNAVDPRACRAAADPERGRRLVDQLGLGNARPLFLSLGRVAANKGFEVLVEAFGKASSQLPEGWGWILVGDGPALASVDAAVARTGISGHARLAGRLSDGDLHSLASVVDWFVHPTLYEGSSIATLEAMAHSLPVIATRSGGLPDKVEDGRTGYLVEPGRAEPLATALIEATRADAATMGAAGRELCEARFSWDVVADQYVDLYRTIAASPAAGERRCP